MTDRIENYLSKRTTDGVVATVNIVTLKDLIAADHSRLAALVADQEKVIEAARAVEMSAKGKDDTYIVPDFAGEGRVVDRDALESLIGSGATSILIDQLDEASTSQERAA